MGIPRMILLVSYIHSICTYYSWGIMNEIESLPITIHLSPLLLKELLTEQSIEAWRVGNYIRIEDRVNNLRYQVSDQVMTLIMIEIQKLQGIKSKTY